MRTPTVAYDTARDTLRNRALAARDRDRMAVATYREALDRLVAAQARYEALQDPRADWQHVAAAARAVVIARADLELPRRYVPVLACDVCRQDVEPVERCPGCGNRYPSDGVILHRMGGPE